MIMINNDYDCLEDDDCDYDCLEDDDSQSAKRVKNEKKLTGSKIGAIFCKITSRITTQNLKIGQRALFELGP